MICSGRREPLYTLKSDVSRPCSNRAPLPSVIPDSVQQQALLSTLLFHLHGMLPYHFNLSRCTLMCDIDYIRCECTEHLLCCSEGGRSLPVSSRIWKPLRVGGHVRSRCTRCNKIVAYYRLAQGHFHLHRTIPRRRNTTCTQKV